MIPIRLWFPVFALVAGLGVAVGALTGAKPACAGKTDPAKCQKDQKDECCPACCETQDDCCSDCCKGQGAAAKCSPKKCSGSCCEASGACCSQANGCCSKCGQPQKKCDCSCGACCKTSEGCCSGCSKDDKKCGCTCRDTKAKCCKEGCSTSAECCTGCCKTHGKCCAKYSKQQKEILDSLREVREMLAEVMSGPMPPVVLMPPVRPDAFCYPPPPAGFPPAPPVMPGCHGPYCLPAPIAMPGADDHVAPRPPQPCFPAPNGLVAAVCSQPAGVAPAPPSAATWVVRVVEKEGKSKLEIQGGGATYLTCKQAELSGPDGEGIKVQASGKQVQVCGHCLQAVADCVTRTGPNDCLTLDGHVSLNYCKDGQSADIAAGHVVIGLTDGRVDLSPCATGTPPGDGVCPVSWFAPR